MNKDIVFVHGWGEDSRIWKPLAEQLPGYNHHFIELGFTGRTNDSNLENIEKAIFVTHSLGTTWALKHVPLEKINAFAAINGFGRFKDFASNKTLETMDKTLRRNIILQMELFWKNCNFPENMRQLYKPTLNGKALSEGLSWLNSWDGRKKLQDFKTRKIPVLSLGGGKDLILPLELMQEHWEKMGFDVVIRETAGHALPLEEPHWCAEQIKNKINL